MEKNRSPLGAFCAAVLFCAWLLTQSGLDAKAATPPDKYPALPSETPARLETPTAGFDYLRREVMIPMRDGVKLHTVILVPKGARARPSCLPARPTMRTRSPLRKQRPPGA